MVNIFVPTTPMGKFLAQFFQELEKENINYCVLRNYQELPDNVTHDVDFLVAKDRINDYENALLKVADAQKWSLIKTVYRFAYNSYYIVQENSADFNQLQIDAWDIITWRGVTFAHEKIILQTRRKFRGFCVASYGSEAAVFLMKEYLQVGKVKDKGDGKTKKWIAWLTNDDPDNFLKTLEPYMGVRITHLVLECAQQEDWKRLEQEVGKVRLTLIFRSLMRHPIGQLFNWICFLWGHFSDKILYPSGLFIVFIGPDGSGKTTISKSLKDEMAEIFSSVRYYHGHFGVLPELKVFYNKVASLFGRPIKRDPGPVEAARSLDQPPFHPLRALIYLFYYTLDYMLGFFVVKHAKARAELVVFDRYYYDYLLQLSFRRVPRFIRWGLMKIIPRLDLVIFLEGKAQNIITRKPELTFRKIIEQQEICRILIKRVPNGLVCQSDVSLNETMFLVRSQIIEFMRRRALGRIHKH